MLFNSTILTSLTLSSFLHNSPLISDSSNCLSKSLSIYSFRITNSISHLLYAQSQYKYLCVHQSKLDSFLKRPLTIRQNEGCYPVHNDQYDGIHSMHTCINLSYSIFRNSNSDVEEGGAFFVTSNTGSTISINQCQFIRCTAFSKGGALYINYPSSTPDHKLLIYSSTFKDCRIGNGSELAGGAIYCQTGAIEVINSTFSGDGIDDNTNANDFFGGAIYAKVYSFEKIFYSKFEGCYVPQPTPTVAPTESSDQSHDSSNEQTSDQSNDSSNEQTSDQSNDSSNEQTSDQSNDSSNEQTSDQSNDLSNEQTSDQSNDSSNEQTSDQSDDSSNEQTSDQSHDLSNEQTSDQSHDLSNEQTSDQSPTSTTISTTSFEQASRSARNFLFKNFELPSTSSGGAIFVEFRDSNQPQQVEIRGSNFANCFADNGASLFFQTPVSLTINQSKFETNSATSKSLIKLNHSNNNNLFIESIGINISNNPLIDVINGNLTFKNSVHFQPAKVYYGGNYDQSKSLIEPSQPIYYFLYSKAPISEMKESNISSDFDVMQSLNSAPTATPTITPTQTVTPTSIPTNPTDPDGMVSADTNSGLSKVAIVFIVLACFLFVIGVIVCLLLLLQHKCPCCGRYDILPTNRTGLTYF